MRGLLIADGLDKALVGVTHGPDGGRAVYDAEKCVEVLMERDGMELVEAREFLEFNTFHTYKGPESPVFVFFDDEILDNA